MHNTYGGLGDVAGEAVVAYAGTDRGAAGIGAEVFWRELLQHAPNVFCPHVPVSVDLRLLILVVAFAWTRSV